MKFIYFCAISYNVICYCDFFIVQFEENLKEINS